MTYRDTVRYSLRAGLTALCYSASSPTKIRGARFQIGACDWSTGAVDDIQVFSVDKQIGLDAVEEL